MIAIAYEKYLETGYSACLAICLNFYLGLRIGELVALKESDRQGNLVKIQRQQTRIEVKTNSEKYKKQGFQIVEYLKGGKDERTLILTSESKRWWDMIVAHNREHCWNKEGFLFLHNNENITVTAIDYRIRKYCKFLSIQTKSNHKIRKTVISTLIDTVNVNTAKNWAGHNDERTTLRNYCFETKTNPEVHNAIEKALCRKQKCNQM